MPHRLPSLNALRAFEAAARHRSFSRAAEELHVSQGAISRHVSLLEDALGLRLFVRHARSVELIPAASTYLAVVSDAFSRIEGATQSLKQAEEQHLLRVMALPTFASRWLVPRLRRFNQKYPQATIRLNTGTEVVDFSRQEVDVAIEACPSTHPGMVSDRLLDVEMVAICHPNSVGGLSPPASPDELHRYTLLHTLVRPDLWDAWAEKAKIDRHSGPSSYFATSTLALQAAMDGLGVGLVARSFAEAELSSGALIEPFGKDAGFVTAYFLNVPQANLRRARVAAFRDWLLAEVRENSVQKR